MHYPQLLVYETDRRLVASLQRLADRNSWLLREPRQLATVLRLFDRSGPGVLVLRLSREAERELTLLEQLCWRHPDAATILIADNDQSKWSALAWDLGVRWVMFPPHTRERLEEILTALMQQFQPSTVGGEKT